MLPLRKSQPSIVSTGRRPSYQPNSQKDSSRPLGNMYRVFRMKWCVETLTSFESPKYDNYAATALPQSLNNQIVKNLQKLSTVISSEKHCISHFLKGVFLRGKRYMYLEQNVNLSIMDIILYCIFLSICLLKQTFPITKWTECHKLITFLSFSQTSPTYWS